MKPITCKSCGAEIERPAKTCPHCGAPIRVSRNLVECRACGEYVAKDARKCPHCGVRTPNRQAKTLQSFAAVLLIVFFGLIILIAITAAGSDSNDAKSAANNSNLPQEAISPSPSDDTPPYIEVSASQLWNAYKENEVNADLLYKDKLLAVTGKISNIGKDVVSEAPCVSLDSGDSYGLYPIQCFFPKSGEQTELLASLSNGDTVTIFGTCTGNFLTVVQLSDCYLQSSDS